MNAADPFYTEWLGRRPGAARSLRRARLLAAELGLTDPGVPVLTVVGSKGKGTAATYASACLTAHGRRVVTVTSPALRADTERVRVDGAAVGAPELDALGRRLAGAAAGPRAGRVDAATRRDGPSGREDAGYLSPSGLFMLAGVLHARECGADVLVLEAGMGGVSDEVSLFAPAVVAITEVFAEHVGILGGDPAEIAADKAGVTTTATAAVVSLPQDPPVTAAISATVARNTAGRLRPEVFVPGTGGVPGRLLPAGPSRPNAGLGCAAAGRLLAAPPGAPARLERVLRSVRLPGRTSWHTVPGTATTVLVDSAINRAGAAAALAEAYRRWNRIDHVLLCLPDHKDVPGIVTELSGLPVTYVRMPGHPHLRFTHAIPADWPVTDHTDLTRESLAALGTRILALGTAYFTGRLLDILAVNTETLYSP